MNISIPVLQRHPTITDMESRAFALGQKASIIGSNSSDNPYTGMQLNLSKKWHEGFHIVNKVLAVSEHYQ